MENFLKNELLDLLQKARAGNATGDDYSRIAAIINTDQTGELIAEADNFLAQEDHVSSGHIEPYNYEYWQRAFLEIKESWQQKRDTVSKVHRATVWNRDTVRWMVAASIIVLISVGVGTYLFTKTTSSQLVAGPYKILPGKDGAILTLADGSQVLLDSLQDGIVAMQGGSTAKIVNGTLIYEGNGHSADYNVMSTPKARKFHVILPDGTNAWLNSASSLRYPTTFTGKDRKVTVTGEVYFEVATLRLPSGAKMPFKVNVNNKAEIEVLGTHFNVKAYDDEPVINTTLLEGSIAITLTPDQKVEHAKKLILKPGQQAQIVVGQKDMKVVTASKDAAAKNAAEQPELTVVNNTDIDNVMAWKNGVFDFNNSSFKEAMSQLERWYDIEVVYEKGIPTDIELNGKISKDVTLNDLVTILEKIGVKCRLEGRKLLIQP